MDDTRAQVRARQTRKRRTRLALWLVLAVVGIVVLAAVWVGVRGLLAKQALDEAVPAASALAGHIVAGDRAAATAGYDILSDRAAHAASLTSDPIWRAAELIPTLGGNLTAVREAAGIVDDVAREGIGPLVDITESIGVDDLKPVAGVMQLQPLIDAQPQLAAATAALTAANQRADSIDTQGVLEFVANAVTTLQTTVAEAAVAVDAIDRAAQLLPPMMGVQGERNYVLLFQNPAELRATGGIPGALAQLTVTDGAISLTQQASSGDFPKAGSPVLELPVETRGLYGDITGQYIQDVNLTPQFDLSARLAAEMWRRQFGVQVDGVISVDPVTLAYLLKATGPIALPTGDVLTSDTAVQLLLSDVYARYPDPRAQDAFFEAAAASVFDAVARGGAEPQQLLTALARAGEEHRILVWSAHEPEQALLAETTLAGGLPVSDARTARIGVYLNDAVGSKMGPYLTTELKAGKATCRADGLPQLSVEVTLTNTAPADAATSLPRYVTGGGYFGVAPGNIRVITNIYGIPGSANLGLTRDGEEISHHATTDTGYPVSAISTELAPGETTTFTASFLAAEPFGGDLVIFKTPEVNTISVGKLAIPCELP